MMGRSSDFKFWEDRLPGDLQTCAGSAGDEIEFQLQRHGHEDQLPQCWARIPDNYAREASPLLTPTSRLQVILDARRDLMEMAKEMPESSYELSFKDMVEDSEALSGNKTEARTSSRNRKSMSKVCRSESMDSGVFLLKMFLPVSLSSRKKSSRSMKNMKICPQPPSHESERQPGKDWWKIMSLTARDHKKRENIRRSNSDISGSKSRLVENASSAPGEWSFRSKKSRSSGLRGCLF